MSWNLVFVDRIDSVHAKIIIEMGSRDEPCPGVWGAHRSGEVAAAGQQPKICSPVASGRSCGGGSVALAACG